MGPLANKVMIKVLAEVVLFCLARPRPSVTVVCIMSVTRLDVPALTLFFLAPVEMCPVIMSQKMKETETFCFLKETIT